MSPKISAFFTAWTAWIYSPKIFSLSRVKTKTWVELLVWPTQQRRLRTKSDRKQRKTEANVVDALQALSSKHHAATNDLCMLREEATVWSLTSPSHVRSAQQFAWDGFGNVDSFFESSSCSSSNRVRPLQRPASLCRESKTLIPLGIDIAFLLCQYWELRAPVWPFFIFPRAVLLVIRLWCFWCCPQPFLLLNMVCSRMVFSKPLLPFTTSKCYTTFLICWTLTPPLLL